MKVGIGSYTYMWSIGVPGRRPENPMRALDLVSQAVALGAGVVQFGPNLALESVEVEERRDVLSAVRQYGLELELGTEGLAADPLRRMLEFSVECGCRLIRTVPVLADGRPAHRAGLEEALSPLREDFLSAGVRLGLENYLTPAEELAAALDALAAPVFGIVLDTVNSLGIPEGPREVVRHLARHTVCLHVKDFVVRREWHRMGFRIEGRPAGQGQLDLPWVLEQLAACSVTANAIVELWVPEQEDLPATIALERDWARQSVSYLRRLIP